MLKLNEQKKDWAGIQSQSGTVLFKKYIKEDWVGTGLFKKIYIKEVWAGTITILKHTASTFKLMEKT